MNNLSAKTRFLNVFRRLGKIGFIERFLRKRTAGKFPDSFWSKVIPQNFLYAPKTIRTVNMGGIVITGDMNDYVFHYIYFGLKDKATENFLMQIKSNQFVIDVGGNLGYLALNISKIIGPDGKVFSFEADNHNFEQLKLNVSQNICAVIPINKAIGSKAGFVTTKRVIQSNFGGVYVNDALNSNTENRTEMVTLDSYFNSVNYLLNLHWLKIDTEGYEWEVLKGANAILNKYKPGLFIEINNEHLKRFNANQELIFNWLSQNGYNAYIGETREQINLKNPVVPNHFDMIAVYNSTL